MKRIALLLILILTVSLQVNAAEALLVSSGNAEDIITLTTFADAKQVSNKLQAENYAALGLMYRSTGSNFLPAGNLSNALALRLVFRSIGKENEANALAHNQAERLAAGLGDYDDLSWADGFYLLALKEGLLNSADFADAYKNPSSPLARDENVSAQNLIKWFTIAHNVFLSDIPVPTEVYLDPSYAIYYKSLYKYGIFSVDDIEYFAAYRHITRDDIVLLLSKFENYILSNMKIRSATGEITGINIKFSGNEYTRSLNFFSSGINFTIISTGSNIASPFADISGEIVVLGKGQPDISGVLRKGDKAKIYYKDDKILFIRVLEYQQKEEYKPSPVNFSGTMYLYDPISNTVTLSYGNDGLKTFYLSENVKVYHRTSEMNSEGLPESILDTACTIYADSDFRGGLYRVYSILTN